VRSSPSPQHTCHMIQTNHRQAGKWGHTWGASCEELTNTSAYLPYDSDEPSPSREVRTHMGSELWGAHHHLSIPAIWFSRTIDKQGSEDTHGERAVRSSPSPQHTCHMIQTNHRQAGKWGHTWGASCEELTITSAYLPYDSDEPLPSREVKTSSTTVAAGKSTSSLGVMPTHTT
jgi:hypothetical protein